MPDHHADPDATTEEDRPTADERRETTEPAPDRSDGTTAPAGDGDGDPPLRERVEAALRAVRDPDAGVTVHEAGLVEGIDVDGSTVTVEAAVDALYPLTATDVTEAMARAVRDVPGVEGASVEPVAPASEDRTDGVAGFDAVIAVASAKGGVGKSTVAAGLACALAADREVGLFDADVYGPNVPTLLDAEGPVRSDDAGDPVPVTVGGDGASLEAMSVGLLESGGPLAWRGAMAHDAIAELYADTAWAADDTLVVDLPPGTGDIVLTTLQEVPVDGVVVVTTPFASSLADAARSVELFREEGVPVLGVVRNMGEFTCPSCGDTHELFPDVGDGDGADPGDARPADGDGGLDAPTLADLPFSTDLQERPVPGDPLPGFDDLAGAVSDALDSAWTVDVPDDAVDLRGHPPDERRERVATAFEALGAGEELVLVSDRDPTPVRGFLADLADVHPADLGGFVVERRTPDDWVARATRP